eukprot:7669378-Pyramimonas_sp.AAC.1
MEEDELVKLDHQLSQTCAKEVLGRRARGKQFQIAASAVQDIDIKEPPTWIRSPMAFNASPRDGEQRGDMARGPW